MISIGTNENKSSIDRALSKFRLNRLKRLTRRLYWQKKEADIKSRLRSESHSLLWVWEFSKKAVLICFLFYVIVQVYAMTVMLVYSDFTYLGDLINQTGEIVQNCVFAYLIKAGFENVGKIFFSRNKNDSDSESDSSEEAVG